MRGRRHQPEQLPGVCEGVVANPDLANFTVTIDAYDGDRRRRHEWEPVAVGRQPDAVPERGDQCLVIFDERGRPWVPVGNWTGTP